MTSLLNELEKLFQKENNYIKKHNSYINENYLFLKYPEIKIVPKNKKDKLIELEKIDERILDLLLLKMELKSFPTKKDYSFVEIIYETQNLINRYQWKAGGYYVDSKKWKLIAKTEFLEKEILLTKSLEIREKLLQKMKSLLQKNKDFCQNGNDSEYTVTKDTCVLINTINKFDTESDETSEYFNLLIKKLNNLSDNYGFTFNRYEKNRASDEIVIWINKFE